MTIHQRNTNSFKSLFIILITVYILLISKPRPVDGLWPFSSNINSGLFLGRSAADSTNTVQEAIDRNQVEQKQIHRESQSQVVSEQIEISDQQRQKQSSSSDLGKGGVGGGGGGGSSSSSGYTGYGSNLLSIAGIRPSSIASLLNMVGDTGFRYFNIEDQCRNRAACDLGFMLYRKLSFVHNWLIRTSVRSLTDMDNIYTQSWMEGMLGRNCTYVYMSCRQSPLDGLMSLGIMQQLAPNAQR